MPVMIAFRAAASAALLLGLASLIFGYTPRWAIDTHVLLGLITALSGWAVLWPLPPSGPRIAGLSLAAAAAVLGLALRFGVVEGEPIGLFHAALAIGTVATVETAAARAMRSARTS